MSNRARISLLIFITAVSTLLAGCTATTPTNNQHVPSAYPQGSNGTISMQDFTLPPTPTLTPTAPPTPSPSASAEPGQCTINPAHDADDDVCLAMQNMSPSDLESSQILIELYGSIDPAHIASVNSMLGVSNPYELVHNICLPDLCESSCDVTDLACP